MMRLVLGKWAVDRVGGGTTPQAAAEAAIERLERRLDGHGGLILLDRRGRIGIASNTARMAWAVGTQRRSRRGHRGRAGLVEPPIRVGSDLDATVGGFRSQE